MFQQLSRAALVLMAVAGLAACSPGSTPSPSPSAPTSAGPSASSGTLAPDTETTAPAKG